MKVDFSKKEELIEKIRDKRKAENNISLEEMKDQLINSEKMKVLQMYSLSHYDKLRRSTSITPRRWSQSK